MDPHSFDANPNPDPDLNWHHSGNLDSDRGIAIGIKTMLIHNTASNCTMLFTINKKLDEQHKS